MHNLGLYQIINIADHSMLENIQISIAHINFHWNTFYKLEYFYWPTNTNCCWGKIHLGIVHMCLLINTLNNFLFKIAWKWTHTWKLIYQNNNSRHILSNFLNYQFINNFQWLFFCISLVHLNNKIFIGHKFDIFGGLNRIWDTLDYSWGKLELLISIKCKVIILMKKLVTL